MAAAAAAAGLRAAATAPAAVRGASTTTAKARAIAGGAAATKMFKDLIRAPTTTAAAGTGSGAGEKKLGALSGATALPSSGMFTAVVPRISRKGGANPVAQKLLNVSNTKATGTAVKWTIGSSCTKINSSGRGFCTRTKNGGGNAMGTAAKTDTNTAAGNAVETAAKPDGLLARNDGPAAPPPPTCCTGIQQVREESMSESQRISDHHSILKNEDTLMRKEVAGLLQDLQNNKVIAKKAVFKTGYNILLSGAAFLGALTSALGPLIKSSWKADSVAAMELEFLKMKAAEEAAAAAAPSSPPAAAAPSSPPAAASASSTPAPSA